MSGLNSEEIQKFEDLGYVMWKRINWQEVNDCLNRALAMFNYEEKAMLTMGNTTHFPYKKKRRWLDKDIICNFEEETYASSTFISGCASVPSKISAICLMVWPVFGDDSK
ncbi:hypothetical protein Bca52824_027920 [Brassica carinata]|uniref:Uncharacterized protein n=1 Tax=Brassica carinata TaxID=52824 RepID=A0A8X8AQX3_BRACI|nr:hypothetical protein Bca52824_027920 [Brassica carinata]